MWLYKELTGEKETVRDLYKKTNKLCCTCNIFFFFEVTTTKKSRMEHAECRFSFLKIPLSKEKEIQKGNLHPAIYPVLEKKKKKKTVCSNYNKINWYTILFTIIVSNLIFFVVITNNLTE